MDRCRIVIVENDALSRQTIEYIMKDNHDRFNVVARASNSTDGFSCLKTAMPHAVICDISLPPVDDMSFVERVRREYPSLPLLVIADNKCIDKVSECFPFGVFDYILKSNLTAKNLCETLERMMRNRGLKLAGQQYSAQSLLQSCLFRGGTATAKQKDGDWHMVFGIYLKTISGYRRDRERFYVEVISEGIERMFGEDSESYRTADSISLHMISCSQGIDVRYHVKALSAQLTEDLPGIVVIYSTPAKDHATLLTNVHNVRNTAQQQFFADSTLKYLRAVTITPERPPLYSMYEKAQHDFEESLNVVHMFLSKLDHKCGYSESELKLQLCIIVYSLYMNFFKAQNIKNIDDVYDPIEAVRNVGKASTIEELMLVIDGVFAFIHLAMEKNN